MKKLVTVLGIIVLAGFIVYPVFAHGTGWGWGRGGHMMGYYGGGPEHCWEYGERYGALFGKGLHEPGSLHGNDWGPMI